MKLRPASFSDAAALAAFARDAFSAAFGHLYQPADLAPFLAEYRSEQKYLTRIADPDMRAMLAEGEGSDPPCQHITAGLHRVHGHIPNCRR